MPYTLSSLRKVERKRAKVEVSQSCKGENRISLYIFFLQISRVGRVSILKTVELSAMMSTEVSERKPMVKLPARRKGPHSDKFNTTRVISNHYFVELRQIDLITIFSVKYDPFIPHDNTHLRNELLSGIYDKISKDIPKPILSGLNIYSVHDYAGGELQYQAEQYRVKIKKVKVYDLKTNPALLLAFLNNTLRNCMRKLNYVQIGKSGKYFNAKEKTPIDSLTMYNGYKSNFVSLEKGFFLRVDAAKKIVRNQTVLQHIDNIYRINKHLDKEERRMLVKQSLSNLVVMSNYGKTNYYTITDVRFDDLETLVFEDSQTRLVDYYKEKYSLTIRNMKQPLLVAQGKRKNDKTALLVPELMLMTGIPDDFDEMRRKKISEFTIRPPGEKHQEISGLMNKLKRVQELSTLQKMGIKVHQNMEEIKSKTIPAPMLQLGNKNSIQRGKEACFNLFNKPIYASKHPINLAVLFQRGTDIRQVLDTFTNTSRNLGVQLRINKYEIDRMNVERIEKEMDYAISKEDNICCIVIPNNLKTQYKQIKMSAICKKEIVTQVFTDAKLRNKNIQSIATKVLLQIIAKRGNTLWVPKPGQGCQIKSCMLAAFDNAKAGKQNVLALTATINSTYSSIFSATTVYDSNQQRFGKMVQLVISALNGYVNRNGNTPKEVFLFQNSCTGDQVSLFHEFFIEPLKGKIQEVFNQPVRLTMIMINVKTNERFFSSDGRGGVFNVEAGTLVSSGLVSPNYDFYIVSQRSTRGCSVPNHYKVIYSDSEIEEGILQETAFSQCFNYVNWTGSIKVPAIMQYAKKLAKFSSEVMEPRSTIPESLASKLYDAGKGREGELEGMEWDQKR